MAQDPGFTPGLPALLLTTGDLYVAHVRRHYLAWPQSKAVFMFFLLLFRCHAHPRCLVSTHAQSRRAAARVAGIRRLGAGGTRDERGGGTTNACSGFHLLIRYDLWLGMGR